MHERRDLSVLMYVVLTFVCVLLACSVISGRAFASDVTDNTEVVEESSTETVLPDEETTGETDVESDMDAVQSELIFEMMEYDTLGTTTLSDVYNVLVNIYNLGLMSFIVALMLWTYHMITKSFRRFIY